MLILNLYLISVAISILALFITDISISRRLRREGFKVKKNESLLDELRSILVFFIPLVNLYLVMIMLFNFDEVYKDMLNKNNPYLFCEHQFVEGGMICCKEYSGENYSNKCSYCDVRQGVKCLQYKERSM